MCLPLSLCPGIFCVPSKDNLFLLNSRGSDLRHLLADKKLQTYNFAASNGIICPQQKRIITKLWQKMQIKQLLCYLSVLLFLEQRVKTDSTPCFLLWSGWLSQKTWLSHTCQAQTVKKMIHQWKKNGVNRPQTNYHRNQHRVGGSTRPPRRGGSVKC